MYRLLSTLFIVCICSSSSCKKSKVEKKSTSIFPNTIGTFWTYAVDDNFNNVKDTVIVKVVGKTKLDNGEDVSIWEINSQFNGIDSNYIRITESDVTYYSNKLSNSFQKKYSFPLTVGSSWINQNQRDSSKVVALEGKSVVAGNFQNSYKIMRDYTAIPGYYKLTEEEWFVPNIGVVFRNHQEDGTSLPIDMKWSLISYQIK